jgi:hypothetical protein
MLRSGKRDGTHGAKHFSSRYRRNGCTCTYPLTRAAG